MKLTLKYQNWYFGANRAELEAQPDKNNYKLRHQTSCWGGNQNTAWRQHYANPSLGAKLLLFSYNDGVSIQNSNNQSIGKVIVTTSIRNTVAITQYLHRLLGMII